MKKPSTSLLLSNWQTQSDDDLAKTILNHMERDLTVIGKAHLNDPHDIKQAINDTLIKVIEYHKTQKIENLSNFICWKMKRVSIDLARKKIRREKKEVSKAPDDPTIQKYVNSNPDITQTEISELQKKIPWEKILKKAEDIKLINLYMDYVPTKKIAEKLSQMTKQKRTKGWVYNRLRKIKERLRNYTP